MQRPPGGRHSGEKSRTQSLLAAHTAQGLFEGTPRENFFPLASIAWRCFRSSVGEEPSEPYRYVVPGLPVPLKATAAGPRARDAGGDAIKAQSKQPS